MREWVPFLAFVGTYLPFGLAATVWYRGSTYGAHDRGPSTVVIVTVGLACAVAAALLLQDWAWGGRPHG